jgi:benzoyl-CoA reductase subunit BamB
MAFALELLEDGILTEDDFPGMPEDNEGRFSGCWTRSSGGKGIGDILANGTYWAAKEIGNGAEEYAHNNIKKHEQLPLKLGMLNPIYFSCIPPARKSISPRSKASSPKRRSPKWNSGKSL